MMTIEVTKKRLNWLINQYEKHGEHAKELYAYAWDRGWPGFAGALDHVTYTDWTLKIRDRGISTSTGYIRDNSVEFVVPVTERK